MRVLFLGYSNSSILKYLKNFGENVLVIDNKLYPSFIKTNNIEFIISYGYRHILRKEILDLLPGRVINLHISYLPWNKGADPNFWSNIEDSPKGVSIHLVDEGLDTGDILIQELVEIFEDDTLKTSYDKLQSKIQALFMENWENIRNQKLTPQKQKDEGTYHKSKDKEPLIENIKEKWLEMKIIDLKKYVENIYNI